MRIVLDILLAICLVAAGFLFYRRLADGADPWSAWANAITLVLAGIATIPERQRAVWFIRPTMRFFVLIATILLVGMSMLAVSPPTAGLHSDGTAHEEVRPREPVEFTISGISDSGDLTVDFLITDHDPDALTTDFCQNEIDLRVTADGGASGSSLAVESLGQARHRVVVPVDGGKDLRLTVTYEGPSPASRCSEDVTLHSFVLE